MIIVPYYNASELKIPEHIVPQGIFIPKDHHYNANNTRKKGKNK